VCFLVYGLAMIAALFPWIPALVVFALLVVSARMGYKALTAFGTARWADYHDLQRAGMIGASRGLILGQATVPRIPLLFALKGLLDPKLDAATACQQFFDALKGLGKKTHDVPMVRLPNAVHTAVFAPTGVGKGVSCIVPFLQTCEDSVVCVDFKGENALLTAEHRRRMGHKVIILDPFNVVGGTDTLNPIDFIDKNDPLGLDDCRDLGKSLIVRTGEEREPQWNDSAEFWTASMIGCVAQSDNPHNRSLQTVRMLLSAPEKMQQAIEFMQQSPAWEGMLARMGYGLTRYVDRELGSVLTTTNRHLNFLDTIAVARSTKSSSFDPAELCKRKMTVYLVLPPDHARAQSPLLRMWISTLLRAVVKNGLQEKNLVHFVLDEAASLGKMEALDDAVDKYRGYGIRLQFYYQSLGQLKKCWPEGGDQTLLSNTTQIFFGVNDPQSMEMVSTRLGEETVVVESGGTSDGDSRQESNGTVSITRSRTTNRNWQQQGRKLLKQEEVGALSPRIAITFTPSLPPIWTKLIRYYEEKDLLGTSWHTRLGAQARMLVHAVFLLVLAVVLAMAASEAQSPQGPNGSAPWGAGTYQQKGVRNGQGFNGIFGGGGGGGEGIHPRNVSRPQP
jgi:type IV secretion system protein VirD4